MDHSADRFLDALLDKYPDDDERFKSEVKSLKRKLSDFNDSDDEDLVRELERVEKKPKMEHACDLCGKRFNQKFNRNRHQRSHFTQFPCRTRGKSFSRNNIRTKHEKRCEEDFQRKTTIGCRHCDKYFNSTESLLQHVIENHPMKKQTGGQVQNESTINEKDQGNVLKKSKHHRRFIRKGAINDNVYQTTIIPEKDEKHDLLGVFSEVKKDVEVELRARRTKVRDFKWYLNVRVDMEKNIDGGQKENTTPHFRSKAYIALENDDNDHNLNEAFQKMNASLEEFIHKGSDWIVKKIQCIEVHTVKYSPIAGSKYMKLPDKLRLSHSIINVDNEDHKCFLWCVLAALHPVQDHPNLTSHYKKYEHSLNVKGIDFPTPLTQIQKFENQNELSINVFGFEENQVFPLYLTKMENGHKEVNLL